MADADAKIAALGAKIDGLMVGLGMMRTEMRDGFTEMTRVFENHEQRDDERFEHAATVTDKKVSAVYEHIDAERRHFATRAWQTASVIIGALGAFAGIIFGVIPYLMGKK